jgi:uncharacterized membrane protein
MTTFILFLHILGAAGMGFYLVLPFLAARFRNLSTPSQEGLAEGLATAGRFAQYALVIQLLTGGYLMSGNSYATGWIVLTILLFLAIGATSGMIQKPMKRIAEAARKHENASDAINRVQTLGVITLLLYIAILWIMADPWYKAVT